MPLTVKSLYEHFLGKAPWVNRDHTADRIEVGDPNKPVRKIATGWSACSQNLRAAAADGCDLYITHEPAFCEFWVPDEKFRETRWGQLRTKILQDSGMALMSMHDTWDHFPKYGIRDSWTRQLGLKPENRLAQRDYKNNPNKSLQLFKVESTTVDAYARHVASRVAEFHHDWAVVMGDGTHPVNKVAVGLGCHIPEVEMLELGADVMVQVFDRAFQTFSRLPLVDLGANLIVVEHGVTEMPGMRAMTDYLRETFAEVAAKFYQHEPGSRCIVP